MAERFGRLSPKNKRKMSNFLIILGQEKRHLKTKCVLTALLNYAKNFASASVSQSLPHPVKFWYFTFCSLLDFPL